MEARGEGGMAGGVSREVRAEEVRMHTLQCNEVAHNEAAADRPRLVARLQ